jgi:hypothetical protein
MGVFVYAISYYTHTKTALPIQPIQLLGCLPLAFTLPVPTLVQTFKDVPVYIFQSVLLQA